MYPTYPSSGFSGCSILTRHYWSSWDNFYSVKKVGCMGTWRTGRRIVLIASTEYITILFVMEGVGLGSDGLAFWEFCYGEMVLAPVRYLLW